MPVDAASCLSLFGLNWSSRGRCCRTTRTARTPLGEPISGSFFPLIRVACRSIDERHQKQPTRSPQSSASDLIWASKDYLVELKAVQVCNPIRRYHVGTEHKQPGASNTRKRTIVCLMNFLTHFRRGQHPCQQNKTDRLL